MRNLEINLIYYTSHDIGWEETWVPLRDHNGRYISSLHDAIRYVHERGMEGVGLATPEQMELNNACWDNL